ncbi:hypothetical protein G4D63_04365 [Bacillus mesophilus]|uniref:DUF3990 domain-containing protein n=1 Tax=Bacillus mesophilus TaxID=1808955 RepID=A0A6M0Q416_9BACI|nr:hypothetical protein [Bacillus mesophilus]
MIIYHGSIREFKHFTNESVVQHLENDIDTIGLWFTSEMDAAKPNAIGTETVIQKSETEFWEDGEPKVIQFDRPVSGFIYKVYFDDLNLKEYESHSEDAYDLFMRERDQYCDYFGSRPGKLTWKDQAILLNKEEANSKFRKKLMNQGYEGLLIRNTKQQSGVTDMYCIFEGDALHIVDVVPVETLE